MIEERLEAVERELMRLIKTLQELIELYIDTNTNPILGDMPKNTGFIPTIVKDRIKRNKQRKLINFEIHEVREITSKGISVLGSNQLEKILNTYGVTNISALATSDYTHYCQDVLVAIENLSD